MKQINFGFKDKRQRIFGNVKSRYVFQGVEWVSLYGHEITAEAKPVSYDVPISNLELPIDWPMYVKDVTGMRLTERMDNQIKLQYSYGRFSDMPDFTELQEELRSVGLFDSITIKQGQFRTNVDVIFTIRQPYSLD